jgi:hypothetical protein
MLVLAGTARAAEGRLLRPNAACRVFASELDKRSTVDDVTSLEQHLSDVEHRIENALNSTGRVVARLKKAQRAAKTGDLAALKTAIEGQAEMARVAQADQSRVTWRLSDDVERRFFEDGTFVRELLQQAEQRGVALSEHDGQLLCYPVIVRVDASKRAVTIDRKLHRDVRPSALAAHLAALQAKPATVKPERFLEALYGAWEYARHRDAAGRSPAIDVRVNDLWAVLTVAPGSEKEYTKQDFGRDLYLLERSEIRETRLGARVHFSRSTGTKEAGAIVISGERGNRVVYSSVEFTRREAT